MNERRVSDAHERRDELLESSLLELSINKEKSLLPGRVNAEDGDDLGHMRSRMCFIHCWLSDSEDPERTKHCVEPSTENAKLWDLECKKDQDGFGDEKNQSNCHSSMREIEISFAEDREFESAFHFLSIEAFARRYFDVGGKR